MAKAPARKTPAKKAAAKKAPAKKAAAKAPAMAQPVKAALTKSALVNLIVEQNGVTRAVANGVLATIEGAMTGSIALPWQSSMAPILSPASSQSPGLKLFSTTPSAGAVIQL